MRYNLCVNISDDMVNLAQVININPSCHRGYEMRHAALHGMGCHAEAVKAFDTMLSKLEGSPDVDVRSGSFSRTPRNVD